MFEPKKIHREAIPKALERVERYRLLNQPRVAESICRDILEVDPENQQALVGLILALTDQFEQEANKGINAALDLVPQLGDEYGRDYYTGLVHERQGKARLVRNYPGARCDAFELLRRAMEWYEKAFSAGVCVLARLALWVRRGADCFLHRVRAWFGEGALRLRIRSSYTPARPLPCLARKTILCRSSATFAE